MLLRNDHILLSIRPIHFGPFCLFPGRLETWQGTSRSLKCKALEGTKVIGLMEIKDIKCQALQKLSKLYIHIYIYKSIPFNFALKRILYLAVTYLLRILLAQHAFEAGGAVGRDRGN